MNPWAPDANSLTNSNGIHHNPYDPSRSPGMLDPSATAIFPNAIDVSQLPNASLQHPMHNGNGRNLSPAFQNPSYQVNPVVPSKRPRPREDSIGTSPRQTPGSVNLSRSQTPQQGQYPPFQSGAHGGQPLQAPMPYQHLQQTGSSNATPSPTMQNQQIRPPGPQRMQTVSPNSFPSTQPSLGQQMSPQLDQISRVSTPQNPAMAPAGALNFMPGYNHNFGLNPVMATPGLTGPVAAQPVPLTHNLQQRQAETQRLHAMRLQQQQTQLAAANIGSGHRPQPGGYNPMVDPFAAQASPGNMGPNRQAHPPMGMPNVRNQEQFLRMVAGLMEQHGLPFNPNPSVCGRPINLTQLYAYVMKQRGSKRVTATNGWPSVAMAMGFAPMQSPTSAQEIQHVFEKNLGLYEQFWMQKLHLQKVQNIQQPQMTAMPMNPQTTPTKMLPTTASQDLQNHQDYSHRFQQRSQAPSHSHIEQSVQFQNNTAAFAANGWPAPGESASSLHHGALDPNGKLANRQYDATTANDQGFPTPPPGSHNSGRSLTPAGNAGPQHNVENPEPPEGPMEHPTHYAPRPRTLRDHYGGYDIAPLGNLGVDIARLRPNVPNVEEMGVIDIRALGLSIQSGIHGEVRYALDHLVKLSHEARLQLELERSEDLVDILVDCATDQIDVLAEDGHEISDAVCLPSYEDVTRLCRAELESLQDVPEFGSRKYDLIGAADRLIAVTTILRNLSFFETNHNLLAGSSVIKFISKAIRLLGTRQMLLRSNVNLQDFMKDIVIFLSNTTDKIELPSRDDALNILHFLLAFAPCPPPTSSQSGNLRFTPYNPAIQRYLPPAIDSLAKLLARDDPNRAFYRSLFAFSASTPAASSHSDLLTRAFGLAISVVPDRSRGILSAQAEVRVAEARKPFLSQGMLAADILASLAPGPDSTIARAWLEAEDGWAANLVRLVSLLSMERNAAVHTVPGQRQSHSSRGFDHETQGFGLVTHRALTMLMRLMEKTCSAGVDEESEPDVPDSLSGAGEKDQERNLNQAEQGSSQPPQPLGTSKNGSTEPLDGSKGGRPSEDVNPRRSVNVKHRRKVWAGMKADVLPKREMVLGALLMPNFDAVALRQLCVFAGLDV